MGKWIVNYIQVDYIQDVFSCHTRCQSLLQTLAKVFRIEETEETILAFDNLFLCLGFLLRTLMIHWIPRPFPPASQIPA